MPSMEKLASSWRMCCNTVKGNAGAWKRSWRSWSRCSAGWGSGMRIGNCLQVGMILLSGDPLFILLSIRSRRGLSVFSTKKRRGRFCFGCLAGDMYHPPRAAEFDAWRVMLRGRPSGPSVGYNIRVLQFGSYPGGAARAPKRSGLMELIVGYNN